MKNIPKITDKIFAGCQNVHYICIPILPNRFRVPGEVSTSPFFITFEKPDFMPTKLMTPTQYAKEVKGASRQTVLRAIKKNKKNQLPRVVDITEIKAGGSIRYILSVC